MYSNILHDSLPIFLLLLFFYQLLESAERVGPRILSLKTIDYFLIREYFSGQKNTNLYEQTLVWYTAVFEERCVTTLKTAV